ncbi:MAG: ankyrin repeat domain-containing protein [Methylophilaceae bacterium]
MKWINTCLVIVALGFSFNALALTDEDEMIFKDALAGGNLKTVEKFVKADPKLVNEKFFGWSPIQVAANKGQIKIVEYLLAKGAEVNYIQPNAEHSAFHLAALNEFKDMTTFLAKNGADINQKLKGDVSLIRYFRDSGNQSMVEHLTSLGVKEDGCLEGKCF